MSIDIISGLSIKTEPRTTAGSHGKGLAAALQLAAYMDGGVGLDLSLSLRLVLITV